MGVTLTTPPMKHHPDSGPETEPFQYTASAGGNREGIPDGYATESNAHAEKELGPSREAQSEDLVGPALPRNG